MLDDLQSPEYIPACVRESLPLFQSNVCRELLRVVTNQSLQLKHDPSTLLDRRLPPCLESQFTGPGGGLHLFLGRARDP